MCLTAPILRSGRKKMKANKYVKKCGPYKVVSVSQDGCGVRLEIYPAFPDYDLTESERISNEIDETWREEPRWAVQRILKRNGGGPSIFSVMALAREMETFLNQGYTEEQVKNWNDTLSEALKEVHAKVERAMKRAFARMEKRQR